MSRTILTEPDHRTCTPSRAARELGLKRGEFDLAVNLGFIRTVPDEGGGGGRVTRAELDRLRAGHGLTEALRDRVTTVGAKEGALLVDVAPTRFTRLARLGRIVPVRFYLNRYRTVIWLYLAEELRHFAADADNERLLKGRMPTDLREQLEAGVDRRARNWRVRHLGFLLRRAGEDHWARAAAVTCLLDPADVADIVEDPYERARLESLRPRLPVHGAPGSPAAELAETLMTAHEPDEVAWLRADLARTVEEARAARPEPRPTAPPPLSEPEPPAGEEAPRSRGLLSWLRRGGS